MKCEDCIHDGVCLSQISYFMGCDEYTGEEVTDIEQKCSHFKNKADYVEVKHGEWIKHQPNKEQMKEFHDMGIGKAMALKSIYWTCSSCGAWGTPRYKYCPECGAKMDGERK